MSDRLRELLLRAAAQGATSALFVVGNPPALRVGGTVLGFHGEGPVRYQETQSFAESIMTPEAMAAFDASGAADLPFNIGPAHGRVHIYCGQGSHNLVFYLEDS